MATTPGYSFAPTFENAALAQQGGSPAELPQGSVKVLNYKLPTSAKSRGISPLMGDAPSGGFGSAVLQSVLQTVLGPDAAAAIKAAIPGGTPVKDPGLGGVMPPVGGPPAPIFTSSAPSAPGLPVRPPKSSAPDAVITPAGFAESAGISNPFAGRGGGRF